VQSLLLPFKGTPCFQPSQLPVSVYTMCKIFFATFIFTNIAQAGAMRDTTNVTEAKALGGDECSTHVEGSEKRSSHEQQTEICKCPEDSFILGNHKKCQTNSRYFNPADVSGLGCACKRCPDIVAMSTIREELKKSPRVSEMCKCPNGYSAKCSSFAPRRYFDPVKLMGKDCRCQEVPTTTLTTTATVGHNTCATAVPGSTKRTQQEKYTEKCKCPEDAFILGSARKCQTNSRYFIPTEVSGLGCACKLCSDIVAGSLMRKDSKFRVAETCKCPTDQTVKGEGKCSSLRNPRYFDPSVLMGTTGCKCLP